MPRGRSRIFTISAITLMVSIFLMALPLVLPRSSINRFLVAIGFIGLCFGLSCLINGAVDLFRSRGGR